MATGSGSAKIETPDTAATVQGQTKVRETMAKKKVAPPKHDAQAVTELVRKAYRVPTIRKVTGALELRYCRTLTFSREIEHLGHTFAEYCVQNRYVFFNAANGDLCVRMVALTDSIGPACGHELHGTVIFALTQNSFREECYKLLGQTPVAMPWELSFRAHALLDTIVPMTRGIATQEVVSDANGIFERIAEDNIPMWLHCLATGIEQRQTVKGPPSNVALQTIDWMKRASAKYPPQFDRLNEIQLAAIGNKIRSTKLSYEMRGGRGNVSPIELARRICEMIRVSVPRTDKMLKKRL